MSENPPKSIQITELMLGITLMSTSGMLSKTIDLPAPVTIWLRCLIAIMPFFLVLKLARSNLRLKSRQIKPVLLTGVLMGGHWVTYFYSLNYSTVAIGMLSLFTYPIFMVFLEPIFLKTKLKIRHIPLAVLAFTGIYFLVPEFSMSNEHTVGLLFGLGSAMIYSFRNLMVKVYVTEVPGESMMFYQILVMAICLVPIYFIFPMNIVDAISDNATGLILLAIVTTVIGHSFFVRAFKYFTATSISLISNLTPLIGILLAWIFVSEIPTGNVYLGGGLIFLTILLEGLAGTQLTTKRL